jgi:hypothetical protein
MGDSIEAMELENYIHETYARDNLLGDHHLCLDEDSIPWIFETHRLLCQSESRQRQR